MPEQATYTEEQAIRALKRIAKRWPKSLWLYAGDGEFIAVMRNLPDGSRAVTPHGGVDPEAIVDKVQIPNDGGDW